MREEEKETQIENSVLKGKDCQQRKVDSCYFGVVILYFLIGNVSLIHKKFHNVRVHF